MATKNHFCIQLFLSRGLASLIHESPAEQICVQLSTNSKQFNDLCKKDFMNNLFCSHHIRRDLCKNDLHKLFLCACFMNEVQC